MVDTPIQYIKDLNWSKENLEYAKKYLVEWDKRDDIFYKNYTAIDKKFDNAEREHFRNAIDFWSKKY